MKPIDWEVDLSMSDQTTKLMDVNGANITLARGTSFQLRALLAGIVGLGVVIWAKYSNMPIPYIWAGFAALAIFPPIFWMAGLGQFQRLPWGFKALLDREGYWANTPGVTKVILNLTIRGLLVYFLARILQRLVPEDPTVVLWANLLRTIGIIQAGVFVVILSFMREPNS